MTTSTKRDAFKQLNENMHGAKNRYVNKRLTEENLPLTHFCNGMGAASKYTNSPEELEELYQNYKRLFETTSLSIAAIRKQLRIWGGCNNPRSEYVRKRCKEDGLNAHIRRTIINKGGRPKGSKNLKSLTGDEKEKVYGYFEEQYQLFLEYWEDYNLSVQDILKKMGTHHKSNMYSYFKQRMDEDGLNPTKRQGKILSKKLKKTFEDRREKNKGFYEEVYQEYKKLFMSTDLFINEIYEKLCISPRSVCAEYIRNRSSEEGLNAHKRKGRLIHKWSDEDKKICEEVYKEYKRLFYETDIPLGDIHKKLGIASANSKARFVFEKAKEEGLDGRTRMSKIALAKHKSPEECEELFQEYTRLFNTTDYTISEIYEKIGVKKSSPEYRYIAKQCREQGLDGRKRRREISQKYTPKIKICSQVRNRYSRKYSKRTIEQVQDSRQTLEKIVKQRNISEQTQKGYIATMHHWFNFTGDEYANLQEIIDSYINEENERIPMRDRTIKKDLLGFREYLINCESMHTKHSIMTYYSKITTVFRHFSIEIPRLPQVKLQKGYISNYNDLPTHDMIRIACEQSPIPLKAVFLFMSSSGSAKAETLSITVEMFMKGCSEYLDEYPTAQNLSDSLRKLKDRHDIVPLIYLRRIKTDKWYYTCCSPEASYMIIESLNMCENLNWNDKLFEFTSRQLLTRFQGINDDNGWGLVGSYRRFRSHALRKFMASNIGLSRDQVDSFQGRSKDQIQEAYFKQDPQQLKKLYMRVMGNVMIFNNWDYGVPCYSENNAVELEPVKNSSQIESVQNLNADKGSIGEELLRYGELLDKGLLTKDEFDILKKQLLNDGGNAWKIDLD